MGLVYSRTESGLVRAEHGADEAAVAAALKQHDADLRLIRGFDPDRQCWVWKVYRYYGPERDAEFLLTWRDESTGEPRPLSMNLLDEVQRHDKNLRGDLVDSAVHNEKLKAERRADYLSEAEEIVKEFGPKMDGKKLPVIHRSQSLRRSRDKERARQTEPGLKP